jgi:hypothetical protein
MNNIVFDKVLVPSFFAGYLQRDLLDQILVPFAEGGGSRDDENGMQEN